jgi:transcriptional regulator with XRE-family HTH domain
MAFGDRLRKARQSRQLTQFELSQQTGLAQAYLSQLESGQRQASLDTAKRLAQALEVSAAYLLGEDHQPSEVAAQPSVVAVLESLQQAGLPESSARELLESISVVVSSLLKATGSLIAAQMAPDKACAASSQEPSEAPLAEEILSRGQLAELDNGASLPPPHALPMGLYELWEDVELRCKYAITGRDIASLLALSQARGQYLDKPGYWKLLRAIRELET